MESWELLFKQQIMKVATADDPAHDLLHFKRVVHTAKNLCKAEGARLSIVLPAAWLHDFVIVPKDSPMRSRASQLSAAAALEFLESIHYPSEHFDLIANAIEAHSFSANIAPLSIEAKIVQDADRLDGLGAIGIARCFATAGLLKRPFYNEVDPFCEQRPPDDNQFTIDHFYKKLFHTAKTLQTHSGKIEGERRLLFMKEYLAFLASELI